MARKRYGSVSNRVYEELRNKIISLQISPGQMLIEGQLTEMFGVSRTPVREAIIRLIQEGFLVEDSGRIYVVSLTLDDIKEIYQVREALEGMAVKIIAEQTNAEFINKLEKIHQELTVSLHEKKYSQFFNIDGLFHGTIIDAAGNSRIKEIFAKYDAQIGRIRYLTAITPNRMELTIDEHRAIITALESNKPDVAEQAVAKHACNVSQTIENVLSDFGEGDLSALINSRFITSSTLSSQNVNSK